MGGLMGRAVGGMLGGVAKQLQQQQQQVHALAIFTLQASCCSKIWHGQTQCDEPL